jgi:hypothetical protein
MTALKFIAKQRFNHIDALTIAIAAAALSEGEVAAAVAIWLVGSFASVSAEYHAATP